MANELQYYGDPANQSGLTVVARVYDVLGAQVGGDVATTEVGALGIYIGDMPAASAGEYGIRFFDGATLLGQGGLSWDGSAEITDTTLNTDIDSISVPSAVANATAVRSELAVELARVDVAISTREAESDAASRAATNQTEHDATQADIAGLPTPPSAASVADAVWDELRADHTTPGTYGAVSEWSSTGGLDAAGVRAAIGLASANLDTQLAPIATNLDTTVSSRQSETDAAARAATNQTEHDATQAAIAGLPTAPSAASVADAVWDELRADHTTTGTYGAVGEWSSTGGLDAAGVRAAIGLASANLDTQLSGILTSIPAASANATAVRTELTTELARLDVSVSSRESESSADGRAVTDQAEHDATQAAIAALGAPLTPAEIRTAVGLASANLDTQLAANLAAITGLNDLSSADIQAALTAQGYTVGRAAALDNLDAAVSSRAAPGAEMNLTTGALNSIRNFIVVL